MPSFDTVLATIACDTNKAVLDSMLFEHGLHAQLNDRPGCFDLVGGTRGTEPEVNRVLAERALESLQQAAKCGSLPRVEVVRSRPH